MSTSDWDEKLRSSYLILECDENLFGDQVTDAESILNGLGLKGVTGSETSEAWHQKIAGVEGWHIDLEKLTYTRVDKITIRFNREHGVPKASISQIENLLTRRKGEVHGIKYGL